MVIRPTWQFAAAALTALIGMVDVCPARAAEVPGKSGSAFFPADLVSAVRRGIEEHAWAAGAGRLAREAAAPWAERSDEELWGMVFGPRIKRSWMVWSDGHCPACGEQVPMYNWLVDAMNHPWKVRCPHCRELFPKNDFEAYRRSGLDEQGIFDPERADGSLLFNAEHPDPGDPRHGFGVDDGEGYVEGENRWRFIGAYLIYGQWKQAIVGGVQTLATAYTLTGDPVYAHKAGVLLDRIADLYPTYDFKSQGILYEGPGSRGFVSTWHDACEEVRELALAYDQVFPGMEVDRDLVRFLAGQSARYGLENPKALFDDIQRNIEERIFRHTLANRREINSNYPRTEVAIAVMRTVLGWPANRDEVMGLLDEIVTTSTAVDGVTGEKGVANYAAIGPTTLASILERYARMDPEFLPEMWRRHPQLHQTFRFHIDTWCLDGKYYPLSGDTGHFASRFERYRGVNLGRPSVSSGPAISSVLDPSGYTFLWRMLRLTQDPDFARVMYRANGESVEGLPFDLCVADDQPVRDDIAEAVERHGLRIEPPSVNKEQWHLAILRSGEGASRRAIWLDYDSHGRHCHADGLNLGLFALGLDLMPDFGYPPVQYGGWRSARARWYTSTTAHNTVVVDGQRQKPAGGKTELWADGKMFRAIRAAADPAMIEGQRFERTAVMIDVSPETFYVVDIFRVAGGKRHDLNVHSHFGRVTTEGLELSPSEPVSYPHQMREFRTDQGPEPGWSVTWDIEDRYGYLEDDKELHLRYTSLTRGASATLAEGWIVAGLFNSTEEAWIPRLMVRREKQEEGDEPLVSTFVSVIEPFREEPVIRRVRRLDLKTSGRAGSASGDVALEIELADGRRDLVVAADMHPVGSEEAPWTRGVLEQEDWKLKMRGELAFVRTSAEDLFERAALARGWKLQAAGLHFSLPRMRLYGEWALGPDGKLKQVVGVEKE